MPSSYPKYASVVLDLNLDKILDYEIPERLLPTLKLGMRVAVPLRNGTQKGYVFAIKEHPSFPQVKPITDILWEASLITEELFELAIWISRYYAAPLSKVLHTMVPAGVRKIVQPKQQLFVMRKKTKEELKTIILDIRNKSPKQAAVLDEMLLVKKGILLSELLEKTGGTRSPVDTLAQKGYLLLDLVRADRSPLMDEEYFLTKPKTLTGEQKIACDEISSNIEKNQFEVHLLHGITGSGKTEIYLQAIHQALLQGKQAIVLVPEISLTQQTIERFRSRFKEPIAVLHHRLSDGERFEAWQNLREGKTPIVIGARSAIFAPLPRLGIIIVDEEHESSYKQEDSLCYHGRDVAVVRGKIASCPVILGSATPSLESYYNALNGKYRLNTLTYRAEASQIPQVIIVDMQKEFEKAKGFTPFSDLLLKEISKRHTAGEQTILFLNRRGYHTAYSCQSCKKSIGCPHCDQALTFHREENKLSCHLCGYFLSPLPKECPQCKSSELMKFKGVGTELLERSLNAILPDVRTLRIDGDTTRHQGSHQKLFRQFGTGKADVLIGTQMIAKGLHFPEVTLVGVINCDASLNIPDFRASETVFQLITQVAGRAGRGVSPGEVIVQTALPEHSAIQHAAKQDYVGFYQEEIAIRELFGFPPFKQLVKVGFSGTDEKKTQKCAEEIRNKVVQELSQEYQIHPVIPAGHAKIKDRWRFQFLIRGANVYAINRALQKGKEGVQRSQTKERIAITIDVNPLSTFF